LAAQLDLIDGKLTLLSTEEYVPSTIGTRSFIDILAKDDRARWVLIELKRSNAAAREAIHEVYKYVEAVKAHLGARNDEIRAIIVSTEWKELLIPFSRFVHDTSISVSGFRLIVDEAAGSLTGSKLIEPLAITSGRVLSPWHEISLYTTKERVVGGLASYDSSCNAKGINDYIMVEMEAASGFYEASVIAIARSLHSMDGGTGEPSPDIIADTANKLERFDYMIYFVPQLLSAAEYLQIISADTEVHKEVKEWLDELEGDELLGSLQEHALCAKPRIDRDYFDIGYPAKFQKKLLDDEGWIIRQVHRRGAFARNGVLSDDAILGEIAGEAGTSGQRLRRTILLSEKGEFAQLSKDVRECLSNNPIWQRTILDQISEAQTEFPSCQLDVSVFVPTTGLMTLFFSLQEDGILYVPSYSLTVRDGNKLRRMYIGELLPEDDQPRGPETFLNVISKYYGGDLGVLVMSMTWGGYEPRDIEVLEDVGLLYGSFRCDANGDGREFFRFKNGRWRPVEAIQPFQALNDYLKRNSQFLRIIDKKFSPRIGGGICDGSSATKQLEPLVDAATVKRGKYYIAPPTECDICTTPLSRETFMSDGRLREEGVWANMCGDCTVYYGAGLGWGTGQLYRKETDGEWLLVAGSVDAAGEDDATE